VYVMMKKLCTALLFLGLLCLSACSLISTSKKTESRETEKVAKDFVKALIDRDDEKMFELTGVERDDNKRFHYEDVPQITQAWKLLDSGLSPYLKCDK